MATAQTKPKRDPGGIPAGLSGRSLVRWRSLLKFFSPVIQAFKLSTDGLDVMETNGGLHLRNRGGGALDTPWFCRGSSDESGNFIITCAPATFAGLMPTLGGVDLDVLPAPYFTRNPTGTLKVFFALAATLSVANNFVYGFTFNSVTMGCASAVPADDGIAGLFHRHVATFVDGIKTAQLYDESLDGFIEDDGSSAGAGQLLIGPPGS